MAAAAAGAVLTFNPNENEWNVFIKRLEQYFIVHNVVEGVNKRAHLLYSLSEEAYLLLSNLCMPNKPDETPYENILQLLTNYYGKTAVTWVERQKFYSSAKLETESALEWIVRLKGLARYCNFGEQLETKLTDIFITNYNPGKVRTELFGLSDSTTLNNAIEKAKIIEATLAIREQVAEIKSEPVESDVFRLTRKNMSSENTTARGRDPKRYHGGHGGAVAAVRRNQGSTRRSGESCLTMASQASEPSTSAGCFRCGRNHSANVCPYKDYICNSCHGRGHLSVVCKKPKQSFPRHVNYVEQNDEFDDDTGDFSSHVLCIATLGNNSDKPLYIDILVESIMLKFELDSGSAVSVLPFHMYETYFYKSSIENTDVSLVNFSGHKILPVGTVILNIRFNNKSCALRFFYSRRR
nr:unnamed protein product [Callosobruchus analis]